MNAVIKGSFLHLKSIAKLKLFVCQKDMEIVIHALITIQLDAMLICGFVLVYFFI